MLLTVASAFSKFIVAYGNPNAAQIHAHRVLKGSILLQRIANKRIIAPFD
jgi:hypothetical protein